MDLKIKHFTKLVIFAVIVAVMWYFHSKAKTFGTVFVESESRQYIGDKLRFNSFSHAKVPADAYRQTLSSRVRNRGLKWSQDLSPEMGIKGELLHTGSERNSITLKDGDDSDADVRGISSYI